MGVVLRVALWWMVWVACGAAVLCACQGPPSSVAPDERGVDAAGATHEGSVERVVQKVEGDAEAVFPEGWAPLREGLLIRDWSPSEGVRAHVVRLDPARWRLDSVLASEVVSGRPEGLGRPLKRVDAFAQKVGGVVWVNGGFFDPEHRPLGLRISEGVEVVPHRRVDWGVFFVADGRPGQVHARDWKGRSAEFAVECGPRLVQGGEPLKLKPSLHRRTVIGHDAEGMVWLIATRDPVELNVLARALSRSSSSGGLGLMSALNLDGGPSTQLHVEDDRKAWDISGLSGVADAIVVRARGAD